MTGLMDASALAEQRTVAAQLAAAGVASPDYDARLLLAHARDGGHEIAELVRRRAGREPLQHILGTAAFRHLELAVGPGVFVPRPETELLVDIALSAVVDTAKPTIVDLCSGCGAIGLSLAVELRAAGLRPRIHLVELDDGALPWLRRNADMVGDVQVHHADLDDLPSELAGRVDLVTANPPYLPGSAAEHLDIETALHDPPLALWGGDDGLEVIRRVIATASRLLRPGGTLVLEHDMGHELTSLLAGDFIDVVAHDDLTGRPRHTSAVRAR